MILRNVAIRHGRKALAVPIRRSWLRSLSTEVDRIEASLENHTKETHSIESNLNRLRTTEHFIPPAGVETDDSVRENYEAFKHVQKRTAQLGSWIEPHYEPSKLVAKPHAPKDVTLELLMASQAHMGHATSLWHPANQRYIYGIREGIHIISLEATAAHLRRAAKVVEGVAYHGGLILFVGTRPGQDRVVVRAAELAKGCHLFQKWIPGAITNVQRILGAAPVKVIDEFDQERKDEFVEESLGGLVAKPDLVVCLNPLENYVCLHECGLANIPTIGIIDTDANPTWVTYPIPANDDSLRSVELIGGVLGRAGQAGHRKRLAAAEKGTVTWETPRALQAIMDRDKDRRKLEAERTAFANADEAASAVADDPLTVKESPAFARRGGVE